MQILFSFCKAKKLKIRPLAVIFLHQTHIKIVLFAYFCKMFELLLTGLYLGSVHILTAPDHLAVLVPLSLLDRKKSWRVGLLWGLGHFVGLLLLGTLLYYFKSFVNLHILEHYAMLYIAGLLLLVGLWILYKSTKITIKENNKARHHLSKITIGTGFVHGFAGFSHIYSLAPTLSMNDVHFFSYFGGFTTGSIASVVLFTYLLCFIPERVGAKQSLHRKIIFGSGVLTVSIGAILIALFFMGYSTHMH